MWRDDHLLLDMLIFARQTRDFNAKVSWEEFRADIKLQYATQYSLQIIGEAASKVSRGFRDAHPEIPWEKIIAFRHRMVHDYPRIELPKVWSVVESRLAALILQLEHLVPPDEEKPPTRKS
jgi:uncharacterized protein with HEPN domain